MSERLGFAIVGQLGSGGTILIVLSFVKYSLTLVFTRLIFQPLWPLPVPVFPTGVVVGSGATEYSGW